MAASSTRAGLVSRRAALGALLGAAAVAGSEATGLRALEAGAVTSFRIEIPQSLHRLAGMVRIARVAVATPPAFDATRSWPLLLVSATSDAGHASSRRLLMAYSEAVAAAGWVALAADPDPEVEPFDDTVSMRFALLRSALAAVQPLWRDAGLASPLAFAGFSGGAKYSALLASLFASQKARVAGIFLSGVNEEHLLSSARRLDVLDDAFRAVPVVLQGGLEDRVATPDQHRAIARELQEGGFQSVRLQFVPGGHRVDATGLPAALEWFAAQAAGRK